MHEFGVSFVTYAPLGSGSLADAARAIRPMASPRKGRALRRRCAVATNRENRRPQLDHFHPELDDFTALVIRCVDRGIDP